MSFSLCCDRRWHRSPFDGGIDGGIDPGSLLSRVICQRRLGSRPSKAQVRLPLKMRNCTFHLVKSAGSTGGGRRGRGVVDRRCGRKRYHRGSGGGGTFIIIGEHPCLVATNHEFDVHANHCAQAFCRLLAWLQSALRSLLCTAARHLRQTLAIFILY